MAGLFDILRPRDRLDRLERALRDGERLLREGQLAEAERAYEFAALNAPDDPRAHLGRVLVARARGDQARADAALATFRDVVMTLPIPEAEQAALLAEAYERLDDLPRARVAWQTALTTDPESVVAHEGLARVAEALEEPAAALEHWRWLVERFPNSAAYQRALARSLAMTGALTEALAAWEAAVRLGATEAERLADTIELARLRRQVGDLDAALDELLRCTAQAPTWPDAYRELGYLYLQRTAWLDAKRAFEAYLQHAPDAADRATIERQLAALAAATDEAAIVTEEITPPEPVAPPSAPPPPALLLALFGLQGGVGQTTIAVNLAVLLAQRGEPVLLLDLGHTAGPALHLGLRVHGDLAEVGRERAAGEFAGQAVATLIASHPAGVDLLVAARNPLDRACLSESLLEGVWTTTRPRYRWVIADGLRDLDECTLWLLRRADLVLLVGSPDPAGAEAVGSALAVCDALGVGPERRHLLWHASRGHPAGASEILARSFPTERRTFLPYAGDEFRDEVQTGRPLALRRPQHRWVRELAGLSNGVTALAGVAAG